MFNSNQKQNSSTISSGRSLQLHSVVYYTALFMLLLGLILCPVSLHKAEAANFGARSISSSHTHNTRNTAQKMALPYIEANQEAVMNSASGENAAATAMSDVENARLDPYTEVTALIEATTPVGWRLRVLEAATVSGTVIRLGEIAVPVGDIPQEIWSKLANLELWNAPEENGKSLNLTRPRLQQMLSNSLGRSIAALCLYPPSATIQRGGVVLDADAVQQITVRTLTPLMAQLPGEADLTDFRLPTYVFLNHKGQNLELDTPARLSPGRLSLRFSVREADGSVARRLTGTVFLNNWVTVPCSAAALNKGQLLQPEHVTFVRKNMAYTREEPWDMSGGPWRLNRPLAPEQTITAADISFVPTITKGSVITIVYESGTVRLSAKAEAMSDGVTGESIMVRNVHSKRQVYATIQDGATVVVRRGGGRINQTTVATR